MQSYAYIQLNNQINIKMQTIHKYQEISTQFQEQLKIVSQHYCELDILNKQIQSLKRQIQFKYQTLNQENKLLQRRNNFLAGVQGEQLSINYIYLNVNQQQNSQFDHIMDETKQNQKQVNSKQQPIQNLFNSKINHSYDFMNKFTQNHKLSISFLYQNIQKLYHQLNQLNNQLPQALIFHLHHQQIHKMNSFSYSNSRNLFHFSQLKRADIKKMQFGEQNLSHRQVKMEYEFRYQNIQLYKSLFSSYPEMIFTVQTDTCMIVAIATLNINQILQTLSKQFLNQNRQSQEKLLFEISITLKKLLSYHQNLNIKTLPALFKMNFKVKIQYETISPPLQQIQETFKKQQKNWQIAHKSQQKKQLIKKQQKSNVDSVRNVKVSQSPKKILTSTSKMRGSSPHHKKQYVNSIIKPKLRQNNQTSSYSQQTIININIIDGEGIQIQIQIDNKYRDFEQDNEVNFHQEQNIKNEYIKLIIKKETDFNIQHQNDKAFLRILINLKDQSKKGKMQISILKNRYLLIVNTNILFKIKQQNRLKAPQQSVISQQNILLKVYFNLYIYPLRLNKVKIIKNQILQKCQSAFIQQYFFKSNAQDVEIQMFPLGIQCQYKKSAGGYMIYYKLLGQTYRHYKQKVITSQGQIKLQTHHVEITINLKDKQTKQIVIQQFNAQISPVQNQKNHSNYQLYVEQEGFYKMDMNSFIKENTQFQIESRNNSVISVVNGTPFKLSKQNTFLIFQLHKKVYSEAIYITIDEWTKGSTSLMKLKVIHKDRIAKLFKKKDQQKKPQKSGKKEPLYFKLSQSNINNQN